jgi:hypothetical protein
MNSEVVSKPENIKVKVDELRTKLEGVERER